MDNVWGGLRVRGEAAKKQQRENTSAANISAFTVLHWSCQQFVYMKATDACL